VIKRVLLFFGLFALTVLLYRNGLHIPYYNDDYQRVFIHPKEAIFEGFLTANQYDGFYRPIEQLVLATIQFEWGWDTFPVRLLHFLIHAAIALLVFHILRAWKVPPGCALAASVFIIVSQLSVYAVASNNSMSQMLATLFSALSLWLLYRSFIAQGSKDKRWNYIFSVVFFFAALLSKETSTGLLLAIPLLLIVQKDEYHNIRIRLRVIAGKCIPYGICFIGYLLLRKNAGASVPVFSGPITTYSMMFGDNIIRNAQYFAIQMALPLSTVSVMKDVFFREYASLVSIGIFTGIFTLLLAYGVWKSSKRWIGLFLCALIIISWFPTIFLTHLMELYAYNMVVYIALLIGISTEYYWQKLSKQFPLLLAVCCTFFVVVLIANAFGVNEKTSLMQSEALRAEIFLPQLIGITHTAPENTTVYLINSPDTFKYSKFISTTFGVSEHSEDLLRFYAKRPDVSFFIEDSAHCVRHMQEYPGITFTCNRQSLRIYPIEPNIMEELKK
jgi:hypothetical protein